MSKRSADSEDGTRKRHTEQAVPRPADEIEYEDPYEDDFDSEEEVFEAGDDVSADEDEEDEQEMDQDEQDVEMDGEQKKQKSKKPKVAPGVYLPHRSEPLGENETLEPDMSTYDMLHRFNVKWPCLTFSVLEDDLGSERRSYPATTYIVTGTQSSKPKENEITVMKLSGLSKTLINDSDNEDENDDDDDVDSDPILESKSIPTNSTTNRIRVSPFAKQTGEYFAASMMESGDVNIWDITPHYKSFDTPGTIISKAQNKPVYTISSHGNVEGYALDWSPLIKTGALLTGDISGRIHLTQRSQSGGWSSDKAPFEGHQGSVEEIQWSPSEKTVFASAGQDGFIRIWDTRKNPRNPALSVKAASNTDINVMSWNARVPYLLASGHDDGKWGVWDLRSFQAGASSPAPSPVASFDFHKKPITSIEFHPSEESIVAVASEDSTVTLWDLSVEADDEEVLMQHREAKGDLDDVPPQLLFVHWQRNAKEVHWNKQIPGSLVSTGSDGFSVWKTISV